MKNGKSKPMRQLLALALSMTLVLGTPVPTAFAEDGTDSSAAAVSETEPAAITGGQEESADDKEDSAVTPVTPQTPADSEGEGDSAVTPVTPQTPAGSEGEGDSAVTPVTPQTPAGSEGNGDSAVTSGTPIALAASTPFVSIGYNGAEQTSFTITQGEKLTLYARNTADLAPGKNPMFNQVTCENKNLEWTIYSVKEVLKKERNRGKMRGQTG